MTGDMYNLHDFLAGLKSEQLAQTRSFVGSLLNPASLQQRLLPGKRPHIAMQERRSTNRYQISAEGRCWDALRIGADEVEKLPVQVVDLSAGGCCFLTDRLFHPSQMLCLEIRPTDGRGQQIFVEVVRARRSDGTEPGTYQVGCRTVDERYIAWAQRCQSHRKQIRTMLEDHESIRVAQLLDAGEDLLTQWLQGQEYNLKVIATPRELVKQVIEHKAQVLFCSFESLREGARTWLPALRQQAPDVSVVAHAGSLRETGRARLLGAEQSLALSEGPGACRLALERALYPRFRNENVKDLQESVKVMLAGQEERRLRGVQTMLLQESYLIGKALSHDEMIHELEMQKFDVLLVEDALIQAGHCRAIQELRRCHPALVMVVETGSAECAEESLGSGADLILSPSATRAELLECLEQACGASLGRLFVR